MLLSAYAGVYLGHTSVTRGYLGMHVMEASLAQTSEAELIIAGVLT